LVTPETDPDAGQKKKRYAYDPHLDPQLVWAGKAEHTSFEVPTVSLHVHERIDPRSIIEAVRKRNGNGRPTQLGLFEAERQEPLREAVEFYRHKHGWSNRLIAGDSLLVMNSMLEKEGMAGKVQMIYIDPPYGIRYGSNFQPFVNKRDVKDGKDEDLTAEPEQIRAFRDTWELGIHSYLTYLRDRLLLARELLTESGSVFVQISDENVHHVRELMDEVFGSDNFFALITFTKTRPLGAVGIPGIADYILWYCRDVKGVKFRPVLVRKEVGQGTNYTFVEDNGGTRRKMTKREKDDPTTIGKDLRVFQCEKLASSGYTETCFYEIRYEGQKFAPKKTSWRTNQEGMERLKYAR
jgi:adenine-specific DNA-methyltransferase